MDHDLFPGFAEHWTNTDAGRIYARFGGDGAPVVLLHGFPQTHACWHRVAPTLAATHRVVCMDLRGYGRSSAPVSEAGHETYSKRAMARDVLAVMRSLGHERFAVVGHDRGGRVGYRLALDHPDRVERLALLDILPTFHVWREVEAGIFPAAHWDFLARPFPQPENEIAVNPIPFFDELFRRWTGDRTLETFSPQALADYRATFGEPAHMHAFCEDYRAGATVDRAADEADITAGRTITCPVLTISGQFYLTKPRPGAPTTVEVWQRTFAPDAVGAVVESGHFVAEENAAGTLAALGPFLRA